MTPKQEAALRLALKRAFNLGQTYWQQSDSKYTSQWKKADVTLASFNWLVEDTINEALAEQPAQQDGPVNEGWQLTVANGHSGYGVYAHMEDYPEEGAVLVQSIEQPAQQEPVALDRLYIEALIEGLYQNEDPVSIDAAEEFQRLLGTHTSPPASRPWVGLTDDEREELMDTYDVASTDYPAKSF